MANKPKFLYTPARAVDSGALIPDGYDENFCLLSPHSTLLLEPIINHHALFRPIFSGGTVVGMGVKRSM